MHLAEERDFVFVHKPELGRLYTTYKDKTWIQYAHENFPNMRRSVEPVYEKRFSELADACKSIIKPLLGRSLADTVVDTLRAGRFVSTADHHGVLCHPFFLNSTLLRSIYHSDEPIITLTCGGVSFSNSSYPRGVFFHDSDLAQVKIPFVPWRDRQYPVYGHKPLIDGEVEHAYRKIESADIPTAQKQKVLSLFQTVSNDVGYKNSHTISDQYTVVSQVLWKKSGMQTDLVYIEIEKLMRQLLLEVHIMQDTLIHRIIFDVTHRNLYLKYFDGVTGAHTGHAHGTQLFWYIDRAHGKRIALSVNKTHHDQYILQSEDKSITIPLNPEEISKHVSDYSIFPCLALCYSTISFYYGITLGGGFSQINYLGHMKKAYQNVVKSSMYERIETCQYIETNIFTGEFVVVGIGNKTKTIPTTLMDIFLWGSDSTQKDIATKFSTHLIGESLDMMMHEFAHIISPKSVRAHELTTFLASIYVTR